MPANLRNKYLVFIFTIIFTFTTGFKANAQECNSETDFDFQPSQNNVNWYQFPEFSLPFNVIFGGLPKIYDPYALLNRGFSHISNINSLININKSQRVYIFYNVADANQPWGTHKSPFGNDMNEYYKYWGARLNDVKTQNEGRLDFDIFCLDIEQAFRSTDSVLALRQYSFVPDEIKQLDDASFLVKYQEGIQKMYTEAIKFFKNNVNSKYFTSYGDPPIFNTFTNIQGPDWKKWQTDPNLLNFLNYDFSKKSLGGSYYNEQDIIAPSAYFYYDYPHIFAGEYLSYLLFQIEANKAWSDKDQILFLWNKYSYTPQFVDTNIKNWMSEAMAIFPFFAGVKGVWLWDNPTHDNINIEGYQYFMKGLYRLSKFKHFFEGNYQLIESVSARDYNENKQPIWRGILKENKILIAAHNPWAKSDNEEVNLTIRYQNFVRQIKLKGYEVFLCEFPYDVVTGNELDFVTLKVYPNPAHDILNFEIGLKADVVTKVSLIDEVGRVFYSENLIGDGIYEGSLDISSFKGLKLYMNAKTSNQTVTKTILVRNE